MVLRGIARRKNRMHPMATQARTSPRQPWSNLPCTMKTTEKTSTQMKPPIQPAVHPIFSPLRSVMFVPPSSVPLYLFAISTARLPVVTPGSGPHRCLYCLLPSPLKRLKRFKRFKPSLRGRSRLLLRHLLDGAYLLHGEDLVDVEDDDEGLVPLSHPPDELRP